jgi:hypothetical protein
MPTTISGLSSGPTTVPTCGEERHAVVFDVSGTLTDGTDAVSEWMAGEGPTPDPRDGAAELTKAYWERGYEILYATTAPTTMEVDGQPILDALTDWLTTNGFAVGTGTRVFGSDPNSPHSNVALIALTDELVRARSEGIFIDYGYSDSPEKILAFQTGGIAPEHLFSLNDGAGAHGSTAIPADDLVAHRTMVEALPKVCE